MLTHALSIDITTYEQHLFTPLTQEFKEDIVVFFNSVFQYVYSSHLTGFSFSTAIP